MSRTIPLLALVASVLALSGPPAARAQDFLGKSADQWLADLAPNKGAAQRRSAAFALGKIAKNSPLILGTLAKALDDDDATVREAAAFAVGEICARANIWVPQLVEPLRTRLQSDKDPLVRRSAAFALGHMMERSRKSDTEVLKALQAALTDKSEAVRQNAAWALGRLGDPALGALRQALRDSDPLVRRDAANSVALLSASIAAEAIPELIPCTEAKDIELRKAAIATLVRLAEFASEKEARRARAPLVAALNNPKADPILRQNAALALSGLGGEDAIAATDALLEAVQKGSVSLRRQATLALKNVGPAALAAPAKQREALAQKAVPVLAKALTDPDEETRMNAAVACIGWKGLALPLTADLVRALEDKKEARRVRAQAGVALSRVFKDVPLGPAEEKAMQTVLRVVADPDDVGLVRERALWPVRVYLNKTDNQAPVFKALTVILDEAPAVPTKMLRYDCAYLLGMFQGPAAPEKALDVLLTFLKDPEIKLYAGGAGGPAGRKEGDQPGGKGFEEKGVDDGRIMAVDALAKIGAARVAARPEIVAQLRALHNDPRTLPNLAKGIQEFLPELERVLKGKK